MAVYQGSVAAATAVVGYDLVRDEPWNVSYANRAITGVAIMGSAALGDTTVDLMAGTNRIARVLNRTTGFPNMDDVQPLRAFIPAGARIALTVVDAPATNAINFIIVVEDL